MDDYLLSTLLGVIEGLTEFLPVSSTAHLRIAEQVFGLDLSNGYWKMYAIVIQLGAILCLPIYFRKRIAKFLSTFPKGENGDRNVFTHPLTLVMIAFVVTAVPAFLLTKLIGKHLEDLALMAWALIIGGIAMWIVDAIFSHGFHVDHMEQMSLTQALWIGACQILSAVFPGTSRSMSTIAGGQIAGMSREAALEFSFFLSMPTMAAATLYDLLKFVKQGGAGAMSDHEWLILGIGFAVSFVVAYGVVAWFMQWVRRHGFYPFAIYRIIVGVAVLAWMSRLIYR
jgi:undecaprenyl-diphosphatase